jgi:hypothetical protein
MKTLVVSAAKPMNLQGFGIIIVMRLHFFSPAPFTRLFYDSPTAQRSLQFTMRLSLFWVPLDI